MSSTTKRKYEDDPYEMLGLKLGCSDKAINKGNC